MFIEDSRRPPRAANLYGLAGVLPFVVGLLLMYLGLSPAQQALGLDLFVYYGAVILSFLGGVRWGAALTRPHWKALGMAVAPSLLAVMALLLDRQLGLKVLAGSFLLVGIFDGLRRTESTWPNWFKQLRSRLTVAVVTLHLLAVFLCAGSWGVSA